MFFVDTETALIQPGRVAPPLTCVQFAEDSGEIGVCIVGVDNVEGLCDALLRGFVVGHNIAYDLLVICREFPALTSLVFESLAEDRIGDTQIREKLLRIKDGTLHKTKSFSLESLANKYGLRKNSEDPWRLRYSELRGLPFEQWPEDARTYAIHDVEVTRAIYQAQQFEMIPDEFRQVRAAFALHIVGASGIFTDKKQVDRFVDQVKREKAENESTLKKAGFLRENGTRDVKKAQSRMLEVFPDCEKTPTGKPKLDAESCLASGDDLLIALQNHASKKTLLGRLQGLDRGIINPQFDSLVASGRTSCRQESKAVNAYQVQNVSRAPGERECFVPADGEVIVACDYESFELCALAQVCLWLFGRSTLAEAINAGKDVHLLTASKILQIDYEEAVARKKAGDEEIKTARQTSKAANFGYPGGLGAEGFRKFARGYGLELTSKEAHFLKDGWFEAWPEMRLFFAYVSALPGVDGILSIKQLRSGRIRGGVTYSAACNSYFQGLAADAAKAALFAVIRETEIGSLRGWRVWNFVHDEILMRGPREEVSPAAKILEQIMISEAGAWLPDLKIKASATAMSRWSKNAEAIYNQKGELIPWEE